ncbi:MAG TPA: L,D-transpeptidase [Gaiellaceae bacterium]|nr:L,D-transpeptidase [Gaiellaceae bacterium]
MDAHPMTVWVRRLLRPAPRALLASGALAALALAGAAEMARPDRAAAQPAAAFGPGPAAPAVGERPAASRPERRLEGFLLVVPRQGREIVVRSRPGGGVVTRLGARTEFGSPTTLAVVRERGRWLGVVTTRLPNGRLGWVDRRESALRLRRTRTSLVVDLSARRLLLKRGDRVVHRMTVGVGRPGSPTPVGRFAVTDKLPGPAYGAYYGCCIVALSAHQPNLPPGWTGGDRIAVHGTNDPSSVGAAASAGCPRARDADLRVLMRRVPLGAPVFVRP